MKRFAFIFCFFVFQAPLFAGPASVTNDGNIEVRVQYKTADSDYQDMYLKPGESRELPGGVEKVKAVRNPGEWASPEKPGEIIKITVTQDGQTVGTSGWYGDKVFFSQPTPSPAVQVTTPAAQTAEPKANDSVDLGAVPIKPNPVTQGLKVTNTDGQGSGGCAPTESKGEPGTITNNGYLPMNITFQNGDGTTNEIFLNGFGKSAKIPDGATGVTIREPMAFGGYTFGLKAVDVEIVKPSGDKTHVDKTKFGEGATIDLTGSTYRYQLDWKLDLKSGLRLDAYDSTFGDDPGDFKKNSRGGSGDAQSEQIEPINEGLKFKF